MDTRQTPSAPGTNALHGGPRNCSIGGAIIVLVLGVGLGGCATPTRPPSPSLTADVPTDWSTRLGQVPLSEPTSIQAWWRRFNDPVLSNLVDEAIVANPSLRGAAFAIVQARALRDVAAAGLAPTLLGSSSARRSTMGTASNNQSALSQYAIGVDGAWDLDFFGAQKSAVLAQEAVAWAQAAKFADLRVQVSGELATTYILLRSDQARLAMAQQTLASQIETEKMVGWRRQAGLASALETDQASGARAQTEALIPSLETSIGLGVHAISILTGRPPAALNARLMPSAFRPMVSTDIVLSLPAETLRQRGDVRASEYVILEAAARLGQADAATNASFSLTGSVSLTSPRLSTLMNGSSVLSALIAGVSLPILDGGASRAQVRANEAALAQARQAYRATLLLALGEVEDVLVRQRDDRLRVAALAVARQSGVRAADFARLNYQSGRIDFQTVLETQRTQFAAEDALMSAEAALQLDHIDLFKALGGGWPVDDVPSAFYASGANPHWPTN
jgi:multidrug efflux system outer membrane protein